MDDEWEHISESGKNQQLESLRNDVQMLKTIVNSILESRNHERERIKQLHVITRPTQDQDECLCSIL